MRVAACLLVGLFLLLSGCTGSGTTAKSASPSAPPATASVTSAGADTGTVRGTIVNDESLPLPGATVGLVQLNVQVETGAGGEFEFNNVPIGAVDVVVQKLGYESAAKKADVIGGEAVVLTFTLQAIAVDASFIEVQPHKAIHHLGVTQYLAWAFNLTGDGSALCSSCVWFVYAHTAPDHMVIEVDGAHSVANPNGDEEYFWMFKKHYDSSDQVGASLVLKLPGTGSYDQEALGSKEKVWWAQTLCDTTWFCFEETRDYYISLLFDYEDVPEGYTARPA